MLKIAPWNHCWAAGKGDKKNDKRININSIPFSLISGINNYACQQEQMSLRILRSAEWWLMCCDSIDDAPLQMLSMPPSNDPTQTFTPELILSILPTSLGIKVPNIYFHRIHFRNIISSCYNTDMWWTIRNSFHIWEAEKEQMIIMIWMWLSSVWNESRTRISIYILMCLYIYYSI